MEWMAWTWPGAIFFAGIVLILVGMGVAEVRHPSLPRKGWLPIVTTRGDRLFIGLLSAAFLNIAWIMFLDLSQWWAFLLSVGLLLLIGRKG